MDLQTFANLESVVMTTKRGRVFSRSDFIPLADGGITDSGLRGRRPWHAGATSSAPAAGHG